MIIALSFLFGASFGVLIAFMAIAIDEDNKR
jgi:uncharacterized membrane protein